MASHFTVRIAFLDVGQGDTIVVSIPETAEAVVVDCIDANAVLSYLEWEDIQHIRGLLITHLHLDHYSGVVQLLSNAESELNLTCERVFFHQPKVSEQFREKILRDEDGHSDNAVDDKTNVRRRRDSLTGLLRWAKIHRERYNNLTIQPGVTLPLEGTIELIHPWEVDVAELTSGSLNNTSGILKVFGPGSSALLTGDIEPSGWGWVDKTKLDSDVLKFPHHGAWKDGNAEDLINVVDPSVVVISVGTNGIRYSHPNRHVFEALARRSHIRLLCTQVTAQCASLAGDKRSMLVEHFKKHVESNGDFFVEQKGCPCAGTVIVELGEDVRVIQPEAQFHRESIIKLYFPDHQCWIQ